MTRNRSKSTRLISIVCIAIMAILALATLFAAYAGCFNPDKVPQSVIFGMCFQPLLILSVLFMLVGIACRWKPIIAMVAVIVACIPTTLAYFPFHFNFGRKFDPEKSFTVMTYNILHWSDAFNPEHPTEPNPSLELILKINPDILCVQEANTPYQSWRTGVTSEQTDSMLNRYPYRIVRMVKDRGMIIYSKFPVIRVEQNDTLGGTGIYTDYRLLIQGHLVTLYNVHMQSFGLSEEDKALYESLTEKRPTKTDLRKVKNQLFGKIYAAAIARAQQARMLREAIDCKGGNAIVCGDFNDIPCCYTIRTIRGDDFRDSYTDGGAMPAISYRFNRMYFRIDHILYRGDMKVDRAWVARGGVSDHFPMVATFTWTD